MMNQLLMSVLAQRKSKPTVLIIATFDSKGGSPTYNSQSGYDSLYVTNPGTPTRSGSTFTGWSPTLPRTITSDTTFVAQWTDVVYTITWIAYDGTILKTENLIYGATSTAPTGTSDTAQYRYAWPKHSTTVTGNETITETQTTKSYTITWKAYDGRTLKSETLSYGSTSIAPPGTPNGYGWGYSWPQDSVVVTGPQTIQETRTTKSYTITWKAYDGATLKSETLWYGETAYAPTGTGDTNQYDYYWPQNSVVVTGPQTIQELRKTKYPITWIAYDGTILKTDYLTYGETSIAPPSATGTAQYEYSWPQNSVVVTGPQTIQETRATRSYTIIWKAYNNTTLKTDYLTYGETSIAPTGTADTNQYDYEWPQNSVVVTGPQTIKETRKTKYTITWKAYNGATLKTDYLTYGETSTAPTGTADSTRYDYSWPQDSVVVTGPQTIQETQKIKYSIIWTLYNGAVAKAENLIYGSISYAPPGTANTAEYEYSWPKSSTHVVRDETIQETRTPVPITATPTVNISCMIINGVSTLRVSVTNNDAVTALIRYVSTTGGSTVLGELNPGASTTYNLSDTGFELPYQYNVTINATATGKTVSSNVTRTGTLMYCMGEE